MSEEMTFEESLAALENLVKELETGKHDLDESIRIYEEAIVLRERCRKFLEDSEKKVEKLMQTADGIKKEEFSL